MRQRLTTAETLTASELCERTGLLREDLAALAEAALLTPSASGRYKPRNLLWACKLANLLGEGWTVQEIKAWTRRRWSQSDPRAADRRK